MEQWLPVVGYEGLYEVSNQGRVRGVTRRVNFGGKMTGASRIEFGRVLVQRNAPKGYLQVNLRRNGTHKFRTVHQLVLEAFVGPRPEPDWHACHNNGIPDDNRLENLRWDSPSANVRDTVRHGKHRWANTTHCPQGHEYTPENTYIVPGKRSRSCRECHRVATREWWRRKKSQAKTAVKEGI